MNKGAVIKYALLPEILPRLKTLFGNGFFASLAYLIAYIFNIVRILPDNHEALDKTKKYSIRKVLGAAANSIEFRLKNIDQIIIFFSVIVGIVLFCLQFLVLIANVFVKTAMAGPSLPSTYSGYFVTPNPTNDVAYRLLDLVFGVPGMFGSKEIANANAFHDALQAMLEFYSIGILIVSVIIIIYYVIAIVAETAQSGIPFGQRFTHAWVVPRLLIFFGMIIPITNGLNGGQYLILNSAKYGSGLATNGWVYFLEHLEARSTTPMGDVDTLIMTPEANINKIAEIPAFMLIAKTCEWAYARTGREVKAHILWGSGAADNAELASGDTFQNYTANSAGNDLTLVFGIKDATIYQNYEGGVHPTCGAFTLPVSDISEPGSALIQTAYFDLIKDIWFADASGVTNPLAINNLPLTIDVNARNYTYNFMPIPPYNQNYLLPAQDMTDYIISEVTTQFNGTASTPGIFQQAAEAQIAANRFEITDPMRDLGWAGAGIWYNNVAKQNGALVTAAFGMPRVKSYPAVMEAVKDANTAEKENVSPRERFNASGSATIRELLRQKPYEHDIAITLNQPYLFWIDYQPAQERTNNIIFDTLNVVLGTQGLFDMCRNADIHPLAQLSGVGRSMIESSIAAAGITVITTILGATSSAVSATTFALSQFFGTITSVGLLIGFILFYVVPFMPFLYFFFAVGGWIKGIFEAMVAVPIWALAHLRIDGDGIAGEAGLQGYFLILEIFIRPILIIFGLISAITIFAAMAKVLNNTFYLAVSNLSGFDLSTSTFCGSGTPGPLAPVGSAAWARGPVDEFFFTIMYAIIIYMVGMACFKLIDMIPNQILRWISAEISSFNDSNDDAASGLMTYISLAGNQFGSQIQSGIGNLGQSLQASGR